MENVQVKCGCGRHMRVVGNAPRGTFGCGCGQQVTVSVALKPSCIGLGSDGGRCRVTPWPEAEKVFSVSLCRPHHEGYLELLATIKRGEGAGKRILELWDLEMNGGALRAQAWDDEWAERRRLYAEQAVVYYVRIRDTIKIGTTGNMTARFSGLMVDEVLATEPGGRDLEDMRHKQFAHLRIRGERFRPEPDLMSHIAMIREHFGEPVMTTYRAVS